MFYISVDCIDYIVRQRLSKNILIYNIYKYMSELFGKVSAGPSGFNPFGNTKYVSGSNEFLQSNSIIAKMSFLILVIFVFIFILRLGISVLGYIFSYSSDPVLVPGTIDAEKLMVIQQNPNLKKSIPILRSNNQRDGLEFSWSVWLWVKDPPLTNNPAHKPNQYKHVFSKGNDTIGHDGLATPNNAPGLYIGPNYRDLVVIMNTFNNIKEEIVIQDIPIEKWMNVIIRCDQHKLDIYINGTLTKSHILSGVPKQNYDNVYVALNGGFAGQLSSLRYFASAIGVSQIQHILDQGPNTKAISTIAPTNEPNYLSFRWFFPQQSGAINM